MFKIEKKIIINNDTQMRVLEANPVAGVEPVIGEGTSFDDFDGFTATNFVNIVPLASQFPLSALRTIRKTVVAPTSALLSEINYATPVAGSQNNPTLNREANSTIVRRGSGQTTTLTINAVPPVGSFCQVEISQRDTERNDIESQIGEKRFSIYLEVKATHTTPALFADYIAKKIEETLELKDNQNFKMSVTVAGAVITLVSRVGYKFGIYSDSSPFSVDTVAIDSTSATTIPAFYGVNNFKWLRKNVQSMDGWYSLVNGDTEFFPIDGVHYTSYFIEYETTSTQEHQQGTIDAVQTHRHELQIYVNPALTALITKLDLIGGF